LFRLVPGVRKHSASPFTASTWILLAIAAKA
jgi:hypothetical protein